MIQPRRTCTYKGHESNQINYVCLKAGCQGNRFSCSDCLLYSVHKHGQENNDHIFNKSRLETWILFRIKVLQQQKVKDQKEISEIVQRSIKTIKLIQQQTKCMLEQLKSFYDDSFYTEKISSFQTQLNSIRHTNLADIDSEFLIQLVRIDNRQSRVPQIEQLIQSLDILITTIEKKKRQVLKPLEIMKQEQILNNAKYKIELIYQPENYYTAILSNDYKYVVSGGTESILKIWNYSNLKLIIQKKLDSQISTVKFTDDSQLLYVGLQREILFCFNVQSNFQKIYKSKIHNHSILNLYCITNTIILTSSDKTIVKTDISQNQQMFLIQAHDSMIYGLDYHKFKNIIVSGSFDKSIKLWDNGSLLMQKPQAHNNCIIYQVMFVFDNDQLLSLDIKVINIWQIRYDNKEIILIKSITNSDDIYNISLVNNQQIILLSCNGYIQFYTIQGKFIRKINHDIKEVSVKYFNYDEFCIMLGYYNTTQLQSGQSIILKGQEKLAICRIEY